jgi:hypothetical protein
VEAIMSGNIFFSSGEVSAESGEQRSFSQYWILIRNFRSSLFFSSFVRITFIGRFNHQHNRSMNEVLVTSAPGTDKTCFP